MAEYDEEEANLLTRRMRMSAAERDMPVGEVLRRTAEFHGIKVMTLTQETDGSMESLIQAWADDQ